MSKDSIFAQGHLSRREACQKWRGRLYHNLPSDTFPCSIYLTAPVLLCTQSAGTESESRSGSYKSKVLCSSNISRTTGSKKWEGLRWPCSDHVTVGKGPKERLILFVILLWLSHLSPLPVTFCNIISSEALGSFPISFHLPFPFLSILHPLLSPSFLYRTTPFLGGFVFE